MNSKTIFIIHLFILFFFLSQHHVDAMKRNRLSSVFRKHLASSSRFWVGKRDNFNNKRLMKHSKQHDIAKNILLWGKRNWDDGINYGNIYLNAFDQY